jgi:hypothetical protein
LPQGKATLPCCSTVISFSIAGRRHIEAIDVTDDPASLTQLRQRWNVELRDQVTLPLIPRLLHDALGGKVMDDRNLAALAEALQRSDWYAGHCAAICKTDVLARVLDSSGAISWRCLPAAAKIRPLPKSLMGAATRLVDLFPDIHRWAEDRSCVVAATNGLD